MAEKLTKADIKKIEAEIEMRKLELRPKLIEAVKEIYLKTLNTMRQKEKKTKMKVE